MLAIGNLYIIIIITPGPLTNINYFGRRVSVLFDRDKWVTKFEDGTEDSTANPHKDKDYKILD